MPPPRERDDGEPRLADLLPHFERFPGFTQKDFGAFVREKQRNPDFNGERLLVKRKLAALGKHVAAALAAAGLPVEAKTSLSHPYTYNGYKVDSMWAYFGRDEKAKKEVRKKLGAELGKDVDPTYQGVILLVEIRGDPCPQGMGGGPGGGPGRAACGLKIHPAAWWDGKNLARKALEAEAAPGPGVTAQRSLELTRLLNALPAGYAMTLGDWKRRYEAGKIYDADIRNYLQYYKPGEVWLHLLHETPAAAVVEAGPAFAERAAALLVPVAAVFRFIAWGPRNDYVLAEKK